ncbi:MAG TPA: hypothetical protein P5510_03915, partial [Clostridia bacterium]|nr:hypothetical protein [Clostridia bacterium]
GNTANVSSLMPEGCMMYAKWKEAQDRAVKILGRRILPFSKGMLVNMLGSLLIFSFFDLSDGISFFLPRLPLYRVCVPFYFINPFFQTDGVNKTNTG